MTTRGCPVPQATVLLILIAVTSVLFAGCTVRLAHPVGQIDVRNESSQSVRVEIDRPNDWPWSLFGPQRIVTLVPTWRAGWCPAAGLGLSDEGTRDTLPQSQITLSGPSLAQPATFPGTAADIWKGGLVLTIDAAGAITVGHVEPSLPPGCESYPLGTQP